MNKGYLCTLPKWWGQEGNNLTPVPCFNLPMVTAKEASLSLLLEKGGGFSP